MGETEPGEAPVCQAVSVWKETKNTVRYAEEAEDRRPVVGAVYVDKEELPKPYPARIRVRIGVVA